MSAMSPTTTSATARDARAALRAKQVQQAAEEKDAGRRLAAAAQNDCTTLALDSHEDLFPFVPFDLVQVHTEVTELCGNVEKMSRAKAKEALLALKANLAKALTSKSCQNATVPSNEDAGGERNERIRATHKAAVESAATVQGLEGNDKDKYVAEAVQKQLQKELDKKAEEEKVRREQTQALQAKYDAEVAKIARITEEQRAEAAAREADLAKTRAQMKKLQEEAEAATQAAKQAALHKSAEGDAAGDAAGEAGNGLTQPTKMRRLTRDQRVEKYGEDEVLKREEAARRRAARVEAAAEKKVMEKHGATLPATDRETKVKRALEETAGELETMMENYGALETQQKRHKGLLKVANRKIVQLARLAKDHGADLAAITEITGQPADEGSSSMDNA